MENIEFERMQRELKRRESLRVIAENQPARPTKTPWTFGEVVGVIAIAVAQLFLAAVFCYGFYTIIQDLKELQR